MHKGVHILYGMAHTLTQCETKKDRNNIHCIGQHVLYSIISYHIINVIHFYTHQLIQHNRCIYPQRVEQMSHHQHKLLRVVVQNKCLAIADSVFSFRIPFASFPSFFAFSLVPFLFALLSFLPFFAVFRQFFLPLFFLALNYENPELTAESKQCKTVNVAIYIWVTVSFLIWQLGKV